MSRPRQPESGVALILTLLVMTILFVVVLQLRYSTSIEWSIARNQEDDIVMELVARGCVERARAMLILDLEQDLEGLEEDAEGGEEGGGGGLGGGGLGGGALGGESLGGEEPTATTVDSLDEEWANGDNVPVLGTEAEVQVAIKIVDEDRKFNLLQIFTPDERDDRDRSYRERARERLTRLFELFREGHETDLDQSQAEELVARIVTWCEGEDRDERTIPRPPLKLLPAEDEEPVDGEDPEEESGFDDPFFGGDEENEILVPLTLEELLMVEGIDESLFYGYLEEEEWVPGLRDVLTIYTVALFDDPPRPTEEDVFSQLDFDDIGEEETGSEGEGDSTGEEGGEAGEEEAPPLPSHNYGRININSAHDSILLSLLPDDEFGLTRVKDFLDWREEQLELIRERIELGEEDDGLGGEDDIFSGSAFIDEDEVEYPLSSLDDLDGLEFMEDNDRYRDGEDPKEEWKSLLTTKSHVFTITVIVWKPNRDRIKVLESVVWRFEGEDGVQVVPIIPLQERTTQGLDLRDIEERRLEEEEG